MAKAASGYQKLLVENRILYNEVQDLKGENFLCNWFIVSNALKWNEIDLNVWEAKRLMGLKVRQGGVKRANSLE